MALVLEHSRPSTATERGQGHRTARHGRQAEKLERPRLPQLVCNQLSPSFMPDRGVRTRLPAGSSRTRSNGSPQRWTAMTFSAGATTKLVAATGLHPGRRYRPTPALPCRKGSVIARHLLQRIEVVPSAAAIPSPTGSGRSGEWRHIGHNVCVSANTGPSLLELLANLLYFCGKAAPEFHPRRAACRDTAPAH